jgi:hypothetical protein
MPRLLGLGLAVLLSACGPRTAVGAVPIGNVAGMIGNDGASLIGNDGATFDASGTTAGGLVQAPASLDPGGVTVSKSGKQVLLLGSVQAVSRVILASDLDPLPVVGARVTVRDVGSLGLAAGQPSLKTNDSGRFTQPKAAGNVLYQAEGQLSDGRGLLLLAFARPSAAGQATLDLASTLASVRLLDPGAAASARSALASTVWSDLRVAIAAALDRHPTEAAKAVDLLAGGTFAGKPAAKLAVGELEDLEDTLVTLGKQDKALQEALDEADEALAR